MPLTQRAKGTREPATGTVQSRNGFKNTYCKVGRIRWVIDEADKKNSAQQPERESIIASFSREKLSHAVVMRLNRQILYSYNSSLNNDND